MYAGDVAVGMQARKQLDKKRRASTVCMNRLTGQLPMHNAHPLRASLRAGDRSQQIMQPALWQQWIVQYSMWIARRLSKSSPLRLQYITTPCPTALSWSISCFKCSKTLYRPCHPSATPGGPWGVINTLRTASPGTRRHRRQQQTALVWRRLPSNP